MNYLTKENKYNKRSANTKRIINKRIKLKKIHNIKTENNNSLSKQNPLDCGNSKCGLCSYHKKYKIEKYKYKTKNMLYTEEI